MHPRLTVLAAVLVGTTSACSWFVTRATTEPASWTYVEEAWGGMRLSEAHVADGRLSLPFRLSVHASTRVDSGICVRGASARVSDRRILVRLDKSVCPERGTPPPDEAELPAPASGSYEVVYDDAAAHFPSLGRVQVP